MKINSPFISGNSSLCVCSANSFLFSDFFPAAMALHRQQGCLPSNVLTTASRNEQDWRLSASMVVQATVCSNVQCAPSVASSATTTSVLPSRTNTTALSAMAGLESSPGRRKDWRQINRQEVLAGEPAFRSLRDQLVLTESSTFSTRLAGLSLSWPLGPRWLCHVWSIANLRPEHGRCGRELAT